MRSTQIPHCPLSTVHFGAPAPNMSLFSDIHPPPDTNRVFILYPFVSLSQLIHLLVDFQSL